MAQTALQTIRQIDKASRCLDNPLAPGTMLRRLRSTRLRWNRSWRTIASLRGGFEYLLMALNHWHQSGCCCWHAVCLAAPVLVYVVDSLLRTGQSGLRSYERAGREA